MLSHISFDWQDPPSIRPVVDIIVYWLSKGVFLECISARKGLGFKAVISDQGKYFLPDSTRHWRAIGSNAVATFSVLRHIDLLSDMCLTLITELTKYYYKGIILWQTCPSSCTERKGTAGVPQVKVGE